MKEVDKRIRAAMDNLGHSLPKFSCNSIWTHNGEIEGIKTMTFNDDMQKPLWFEVTTLTYQLVVSPIRQEFHQNDNDWWWSHPFSLGNYLMTTPNDILKDPFDETS